MDSIELYPIFNRFTLTYDHYEGEILGLGDDLGRDCMVASLESGYVRLYKGDGKRNEDWESWNAEVLSPVNGKVRDIYLNPTTNSPGTMTPGRASMIRIERADGLNIILAHIQSPLVSVGDSVEEGQKIAHVGNNGYARNPHIHIGAFKGDKPLSITFDPQKTKEAKAKVSDQYWFIGKM